MTFTVVGTSTMSVTASTNPQAWTLPVPAGTSVGDVLALGFYGARGFVVTDARLTPSAYDPTVVSPIAGSHAGAWGVATDLTDVTFTTNANHPGLAVLVALSGVTVDPVPVVGYSYPADSIVLASGDITGTAALMVVADARQHANATVPPWDDIDPIGDAVGWSTVDDARWDPRRAAFDNDFHVKVFSRAAGPLVMTAAIDATRTFDRAWYALVWDLPIRGHLRQRQRPSPARLRQVASPAQLRQVIR